MVRIEWISWIKSSIMLAVKLAPKGERANQNPCADQVAPTVAAVVDLITGISVGDQDLDPQDPHVF